MPCSKLALEQCCLQLLTLCEHFYRCKHHQKELYVQLVMPTGQHADSFSTPHETIGFTFYHLFLHNVCQAQSLDFYRWNLSQSHSLQGSLSCELLAINEALVWQQSHCSLLNFASFLTSEANQCQFWSLEKLYVELSHSQHCFTKNRGQNDKESWFDGLSLHYLFGCLASSDVDFRLA